MHKSFAHLIGVFKTWSTPR